MQAYAGEFLNLHDHLRIIDVRLPELMLTNQFIGGLHHVLREKVLSRKPMKVEDALNDAVYCENYMGAFNMDNHLRRPMHPAVNYHGYARNEPTPRDSAFKGPRRDNRQFDRNYDAKPNAQHSRPSF